MHSNAGEIKQEILQAGWQTFKEQTGGIVNYYCCWQNCASKCK